MPASNHSFARDLSSVAPLPVSAGSKSVSRNFLPFVTKSIDDHYQPNLRKYIIFDLSQDRRAERSGSDASQIEHPESQLVHDHSQRPGPHGIHAGRVSTVNFEPGNSVAERQTPNARNLKGYTLRPAVVSSTQCRIRRRAIVSR